MSAFSKCHVVVSVVVTTGNLPLNWFVNEICTFEASTLTQHLTCMFIRGWYPHPFVKI